MFKFLDNNSIESYDMVNQFIYRTFPHKIEFSKSSRTWLKETFGEQLISLVPIHDKSNIFPVLNENAVWVEWGNFFWFKNSNDLMFYKLTIK